MKTITCSIGLLAVSLLIVSPAASAQTKIGYVNPMAVFEGTIEGKAIMDALKNEFGAKQKVLDDRKKAFEEKAKQFQAQMGMLKEDVRRERGTALAKEQDELINLMQQYQNEINGKKGEALSKFEQKLLGVIEGIAKREGLDYIVRHEVLLFGPPKMNVTNEVIREYDKRNPGAKGK